MKTAQRFKSSPRHHHTPDIRPELAPHLSGCCDSENTANRGLFTPLRRRPKSVKHCPLTGLDGLEKGTSFTPGGES